MLAIRRLAKDIGKVFIKQPDVLTRAQIQARYLTSSRNPVSLKHGDLVGYCLPDSVLKYSEKDVILYNMGVGASLSSGHTDILRYLYEKNDMFSVLPTFGTLVMNKFFDETYQENIPLSLDVTKFFHGEHFVEIKKELKPRTGKLTSKTKISDVLDKGKGTVLVVDVDTFDEDGSLIVKNQGLIYTTQYYGWGGKRKSDLTIPCVPTPDRSADVSVTENITIDQAALYRLNGDRNPFHIDPMMAAGAGFPRPILQGMCTFGFSARHVIDKFCDNETKKFKSSKLRFSAPVLPGQTIQTDMWKEGSRVHFTTTVVDTGAIYISGAYVDLRE